MKAFVLNASSYHRYVTTPKGNKYSFFGGENTRPIFVKDSEDIKWFEEHIEFTEVEELTSAQKEQAEENEPKDGVVGDVKTKGGEIKDERPLKSLSLKELKAKAKNMGIGIEGDPSKRILIDLIKNYISTTD